MRVATFHLPGSAKQPIVICKAANYGGSVEVESFIGLETESPFWRRVNEANWQTWVIALETEGLSAEDSAQERFDFLDHNLRNENFAAIAGNAEGFEDDAEEKFWHRLILNLKKKVQWEAGGRKQARDYEKELRNSYSLSVADNPVFDWLRRREAYVEDAFLQSLMLLKDLELDSRTVEQREADHMSQYSDGQTFTFRW